MELGGPQVQAYPADPSGVVRNDTRLNLLIVVRIGDNGLDDETRGRSADGVVAYSGVCTHQGCPVNMWSRDRKAVRLLLPWFDLRSERTSAESDLLDRRRGLWPRCR